MGTFRARFVIFSETGTAFSKAGVGDDAYSRYQDVTASGVINFHLFGNCYYLDGSVTPISFASLPAGFAPIPPLVLTTPNLNGSIPFGPSDIFYTHSGGINGSGQVYLTYGVYTSLVLTSLPDGLMHSLGIADIPFSDAIDLSSMMGIHVDTTFDTPFNHTIRAGLVDVIDIEGEYSVTSYTYELTPPSGSELDTYDTFEIVNPDPASDDTLDLTHVTITLGDCPVEILFQDENRIVFSIPDSCINDGLVSLIATGDGTQFSGSITLGSYTILNTNGSGIYVLVKDKTNDTLYNTARDGTTRNVRIPRPFIKTGFIGG